MAIQTIDAALLSTVHGGFDLGGGGIDLSNIHGGPSQPTDGIACTPGDPYGQRARQYYSNPAPRVGGGDGNPDNPIHPEMPIDPWAGDPYRQRINRVGPRLPGRSDRRLKRRIRAL
jgi:hypothetical protein